MSTSIDQISEQLTRLVRTRTGDPRAAIREISPLPGHAGFGYSFVLDRTTPGGASGKLALRVAPEGVRIAGPADVIRQARIMRSLADTDVPVPPIIWYGDEAEFFGRPYFVDGFVDGFKLADNPPISREETHRLALKGIEKLAALHRVEWSTRRDAWGDPTTLGDEMKRLDHLLDRPTLDPAVVARGPELRAMLYASLPDRPRIGCVHGDFQWSNVLFRGDRVAALIDWEIALLGPTLLDVGWICFFSDPASFHGQSEANRSAPLDADEIVAAYSEMVGFHVAPADVRWFRAFAGYRFGVITCFNLMLHRRGKRLDPHWEDIALSAPTMFSHGIELLG